MLNLNSLQYLDAFFERIKNNETDIKELSKNPYRA